MDFNSRITPFAWCDLDDGCAYVTLYASEKYKNQLFKTRKKEGFTGNGYDWESLAQVFIRELVPDLLDDIQFDSEYGMFEAHSSNLDALKQFIVEFKKTCETDDLIDDIFSRAEPQKPIAKEDIKRVLDLMMNKGKD